MTTDLGSRALRLRQPVVFGDTFGCARRDALERIVPEGYHVDSQEPVTTEDSEPAPDVAVVREARRDFADRHPGPADVPLVVEVADDSLVRDRETKRPLYARAGIAQHWIVDVRTRAIEVHRAPAGDAYTTCERVVDTDELTVEFDGTVIGRIAIAALLP